MNCVARLRPALLIVLAVVAIAGAVFGIRQVARADASDGLGHVLGQIRGFLSIDFENLVSWAKNGATPPSNPVFSLEKAEASILNLSSDDRNAVLEWLKGNGRSALHVQGATDSEIGSARSGVDAPAVVATPNPWRTIPLATTTLDGGPQGQIAILGGFAAVMKNGTAAIACVSFKNVDPRVAKRVVFEFPLLGDGGQELGKLVLDRSGEFTPNIDIHSYESMASWQSGTAGPRSLGDGCIQRSLPTAALPVLQARAAGYRVMRVDYVNGSSWTPAGAVPQAQ